MKYKKLSEVCTLINGRAYKQDELLDSGKYPVLRVGNFFSDKGYYFSDLELEENKYCDKGDLLFAWSASFGPKIWKGRKAIYHYHIWKIVLTDLIDKEYLFFYLQFISNEVKSAGHGAVMIHTTKAEMEQRLIPLSSLEEQRSIATVLSKVETILDRRKQQLSELDTLIKARFVEMFGDPVSNSFGLSEKTLPELGEFGRGVSKHRPRNAHYLLGGPYPLIQTGDVANAGLYITEYENTYSELGLQQSKMWNAGTLCITIAANIAKTAILTFDACFPDSMVGFNANQNTNNVFIHYWFSFFQEILEAQAPESAQKNINLKILSELKVIVPESEQQNEFADFVVKVHKLRVATQKSLDKTQELFDCLMQEYFG